MGIYHNIVFPVLFDQMNTKPDTGFHFDDFRNDPFGTIRCIPIENNYVKVNYAVNSGFKESAGSVDIWQDQISIPCINNNADNSISIRHSELC